MAAIRAMPSSWIASLRRARPSRAAPRPTRSPNRSRTDMSHVTTGARVRQGAALRTRTWLAADAPTELSRALTPSAQFLTSEEESLQPSNQGRLRAPTPPGRRSPGTDGCVELADQQPLATATSARRCVRGLISGRANSVHFAGCLDPSTAVDLSSAPRGYLPGPGGEGMVRPGSALQGGLTISWVVPAGNSKPDHTYPHFLRKFYLRNVTKTPSTLVVELLGCSARARVRSFLEDSPDPLASSS